MFSIEQSPFLQALGRAIGNSLWQVAALWLAYAAISNVSRLNARRKYQLAAGASLAGLIWFVITLVYAYATIPVYQSLSTTYIDAATGSSFPDYLVYFYHSASVSIQSLAPYISCAYLLMFVILGIRLGNSFRQIQFITTQGLKKVDVELRLFVKENAARLGIAHCVKIFASPYVQGPLTMGFWKPVILMPIACLNHLTTTEVEAILLHELAHIRRHDYLVNIFLQIAEISLFFNPFMRLLLKNAKQERENNCDDYVLQFGYSPKDYAKALLAINHGSNMALLALAAKGNQSFQLLNRVKRMVAPQPTAFNYRQQLGLLLLFTVLMLGFTVIIPKPKQAMHKIATAGAKKISAEKKVPPPVVAEWPVEPATPQRAYNLISTLTNYSHAAEQLKDEKALNATIKEIELHTEDIEALGKEIEETMKPVTDQVTAWADGIADAPETLLTSDRLKTLINLETFKSLPVQSITEISEEYKRKLMSKLDHLLKTLPFTNNIAAYKNATATYALRESRTAYLNDQIKEKINTVARADYARLQATRRNFNFNEAQHALKEKTMAELQILQGQTEAKQLEAVAKVQRLHLGLLTDDRDTCKAEGEGLLAKLQSHKPSTFNMHFKTNASFAIPSEIRVNGRRPGKCVITITENDVKIVPDAEPAGPATFNINGQNIDIRQETQINNGKEEKVVVISISSSK